jgi:hypothetical protein
MNIETLKAFLRTQSHPSNYLGKYPYRFSTLISDNYQELAQNVKMFKIIYLEINQDWDNLNPEVQVELMNYFTSLNHNFFYRFDILASGRKSIGMSKDRFEMLKELVSLHQKIHHLLVIKNAYVVELYK